MIPKITLAAGCITFLFFVCRIEQAMLFVNTSIMQGFSLSVAFVIGFSQLEMFLGTQPQTFPNYFVKLTHQLMQVPNANSSSVVYGSTTFIILFALSKWKPNIPWIIVISVAGMGIGFLSSSDILPRVPLLGDKFPNMTLNLFQFEWMHSSHDFMDIA